MDGVMWFPLIDLERCTGCGDCVTACPTRAIALVESKAALLEPERCDYSGLCERVCPVEAISVPYLVVMGTA